MEINGHGRNSVNTSKLSGGPKKNIHSRSFKKKEEGTYQISLIHDIMFGPGTFVFFS